MLSNRIILFSCFARCVATLYPGLFSQLTIGLIALFYLCNYMVTCVCVHMRVWCFGFHIYILPCLCFSYYVIACINGGSGGFLLFVSLVFC
jgi:hypothetical protein